MRVKKLAARSLAGALGLLLALSLVLVPFPALASMPEMGHIFYGNVTIDGEPVIEGTPITVSVPDGPDYIIETIGAEGSYGQLVDPDDPDTPEKDGAYTGDLIAFYIDGDLAQLYDVEAGGECGESYPFEIQGLTELKLMLGEAPVQYTLTVDSSDGGNVTQPGEGVQGPYDPEAQVPLLAVADDGFVFDNWTGDVSTIDDCIAADTVIIMNGDYVITANFKEGVTYALFVNSSIGGNVTQPGQGTFHYPPDTVVDLLAVADDGYVFGKWCGDVANVNAASTNITMTDDETVHANFVEFSAPEDVSLTEADEGVLSVNVTAELVEELDVTEMPADIEPQEAYVVEPTGTGNFTLAFTDVSYASDIRVYKVVDGTWTLLLEEVMVVDATTIEVTMDCADPVLVFALPPALFPSVTLPDDWNLLSTPILLDAESDNMGQIFDTESYANIDMSYRWDADIEDWVQVLTDYELLPLYAIYVKVSSGALVTAEFIPSGEISAPPTRALQPGLNLIGPAPVLDDSPDMPLDQALISIEEAEGGLRGYTMVISPDHNQPPWTYCLGGDIENLLPFNGYWVAMTNAATLVGCSTTPIP